MNNHLVYKMVIKAKNISPLNIRHLEILIKWFIATDKKELEFGFREARGLDQQLEMAVEFLLRTEREWQSRISENQTNLSFPLYMEYKGKEESIDLPNNFNEILMKGLDDELSTIG